MCLGFHHPFGISTKKSLTGKFFKLRSWATDAQPVINSSETSMASIVFIILLRWLHTILNIPEGKPCRQYPVQATGMIRNIFLPEAFLRL